MSSTGEMKSVIIEYARFHGVATDHLAIDPHNYLRHPDSSDRVAFPDDVDEIHQSEDIQLLLTDNASEKLDIRKHGAMFLSSSIKVLSLREGASCQQDWDIILPDYGFIRNVRAEEPVLGEDHELDMLSFRAQNSLDRIDLDLPLEPINDERDEGIAFPSYCQGLPSQMQEGTAKEKLDCTRETLRFMEKIRKPLLSSAEDAHQLVYAGMAHHTKHSVQSITPPLLSRDPTPVPYVPPEPSMELECASPRESQDLPERNQIGQFLIEDFKWEHANAGCIAGYETGELENGMPLIAIDASHPENGKFISPKRPLLVDLKVDGPITPPQSTKKRCTQERRRPPYELLQTVVRHSLPDAEPDSGCAVLLGDNLASDVMAATKEVENKLDLERPRTVAPSVWANVPSLVDFVVIPPWSNRMKSHSRVPESCSLAMTLLQRHFCGIKLEEPAPFENNLQWNPFPQGISEPVITESIDDHCILGEILVKPSLEQGIVQDEFFRLFPAFRLNSLAGEGDNDQEDLISPRSSPKQIHGITVNEFHNDGSTSSESSKSKEVAIVTDPKPALPPEAVTSLITNRTGARKTARTSTSFSLFSSQFSAGKQLANFMDIRGQKSKRIEVGKCPYFKTSSSHPSEHESNDKVRKVAASSGPRSVELDQTIHIGDPLPVPVIAGALSQRALVVSFSLLHSHRRVVHALEALCPPATLVFREPSLTKSREDTSIRDGKSSTSPLSNVDQKGLEEADIVLSPAAAILLTTSQETTQLYLPGHRPINLGTSQGSPLRDRICTIYLRYECLYVLICHSAFQGSGNLVMDDKTASSVRSLVSFCISLSSSCYVRPLLVPSSAETLTEWIISLSNKHHFSRPSWVDPDRALLTPQEPTTWEHFLRRVGLNPYAAQFVLSSLHRHPQKAVSRFVDMGPHARMRVFAPTLGENVVARVNKLLEIVW